jgi:hypothetical protein
MANYITILLLFLINLAAANEDDPHTGNAADLMSAGISKAAQVIQADHRNEDQRLNGVKGQCFLKSSSIEMPCSSVEFSVLDPTGTETLRFRTESDGTFRFKLPTGELYTLRPSSKSYKFVDVTSQTAKKGDSLVVRLKILTTN